MGVDARDSDGLRSKQLALQEIVLVCTAATGPNVLLEEIDYLVLSLSPVIVGAKKGLTHLLATCYDICVMCWKGT
uniref:Uncharacterized protein n=1 Tax=Peronospora matthiolae TaxID=2874970 RepID=A0AAV1T519_9STRA